MVKRYTQPVVQTVKGLEFKVEEVPLFLDPKGRWVEFADYHALSLQLANRTAELVAVQGRLADANSRILASEERTKLEGDIRDLEARLAETERVCKQWSEWNEGLRKRLADAERTLHEVCRVDKATPGRKDCFIWADMLGIASGYFRDENGLYPDDAARAEGAPEEGGK